MLWAGTGSPEAPFFARAAAIDRIKRGEDPKPPEPAPEPTVADLAALCLKNHVAARCKPRTAKNYRIAIECHILPALGGKALKDVMPEAAGDLHHGLRATPAAAKPGDLGSFQDVLAGRELGDGPARQECLSERPCRARPGSGREIAAATVGPRQGTQGKRRPRDADGQALRPSRRGDSLKPGSKEGTRLPVPA